MKFSEIYPEYQNNYQSLDGICLCARAILDLGKKRLNDDTPAKRFRIHHLMVLVNQTSKINKKFPITEDGIIWKLGILAHREKSDVNLSPVTIVSLAAHFPSVIAQHELCELDDQWRSFRLCR